MPFFDVEQPQVPLPIHSADPELESPVVDIPFSEQLAAAYRRENSIGSLFAQENGLPDSVVDNPDFNPFDHLEWWEKEDEDFTDLIATTDSVEEINAVRRQRQRELEDQQKAGFAASMTAVLIDPINLIPVGGTMYKTYRTGASILKGAAATGAASAVAATVSEAALQSTQIARTYGESATNVAASALLGGALGATPMMLNKWMDASGTKSPEQAFDDIAETMDPEGAIANGGNSVMTGDMRSMGAAEVMDDPVVRAEVVKKLTRWIGFDPLSRTITSGNRKTRVLSSRLVENPIEMEGALTRQAVESRIKTYMAHFYNAHNGYRPVYKAYRKDGGTLNKRDFRVAISKAVRNGSDNEFIQKSADIWDAEVYQPIKNMAVEAGILPKDVDVKTAANYLNRVWKKEVITAKMGQFVDTVSRWLDDQQEVKTLIKDPVAGSYMNYRQQAAKVRSAERQKINAVRNLGQAKKQLEEIQRVQKRSIERQFKLEDLALSKALKKQRKIEETARKSVGDEIENYQSGQVKAIERVRDKAIAALEKEAKAIAKSGTKKTKMIAEMGGLNREAWKAEGVDPAAFTDKSLTGGFGKPLFRKNGGMTADDLAEKLHEAGIISSFDANKAIAYVDDMLRNGDDFADLTVHMDLDDIELTIVELHRASDEDIADVFLGGYVDSSPAPEYKTGAMTEQGEQIDPEFKRINKFSQREIKVASTGHRSRSNILHDRVSGLNHKIKTLDDAIAQRSRLMTETLAELEELAKDWPSKSANKLRQLLKNRETGDTPKLTTELKSIIGKIIKTDLDDYDSVSLAREIAGRILSTPDGRLPYDYKMGSSASMGGSKPVAGPFKNRSFVIPDKLVEDFLENDIEELAYSYIQKVAPDIELAKEFGLPDEGGNWLWREIKEIQDDYLKEIDAASRLGNGKQAIKIRKEMNSDIRDMAAMRDRIRRVYNIPSNQDNPWLRIGRSARDLNYMRLLGGVVWSSIPDVSRVVAAEGMANTFRYGLTPLATNLRAFNLARSEVKSWGVGIDALTGGRVEVLADVGDYSRGGTALERGIHAAAQRFSTINGMNFWTGGLKQLHAVVMQTRLIKDMNAGKYDKRLASLGIDEGAFKSISAQAKAHAKEIDGVWIANTGDWTDPDLVMMWKAAMHKASDEVIIVPGQEKPLFMSTEMGKTVFQFKTFMFSATQRILLTNLQAKDKHFMQGIVGMITLGMMSYALKQWDADREISDDPATLIMEGIDRSGMLGFLMEVNNTLEKISSNNIGLRPMTGISAPASRYASRSVAESAMGPTFGALGDTVTAANAILNGQEWADSDTRALRRLLPYQNLSIFRQGVDAVEEQVNKSIGN